MTDLWSQALGQLRTTTKRSVVDSFFEKINLVQYTDGALGRPVVQLGVPDDHCRDYILTHYLETIRACLQELTNGPLDVQLVVTQEWSPFLPEARAADVALPAAPTGQRQASLDLDGSVPLAPNPWSLQAREMRSAEPASDYTDHLVPRFTFDTFVVGQANELAVAQARSVAEVPGTAFNPLFIHGGIGLGKTHLLHAIGQLARQRNPGLRVRFVAAETYADDTISAMRSRDPSARADVRNLYRNQVDLLLVDDIQFLQGKTHTQEEFFHLFNALHQAGKHIVMTSDRFPSELGQFHERLRSRFEWGMTCELTPPDRDLRVAILRRKAMDLGLLLPPDVTYYLADHLRNSVRELEGALNKLAAHSRIGQRALDMTLARSVLGPIIELPSRYLTVEVIQRVTAQHYGLKVVDLKGSKRHRSVVVPRMVAIYLTRKHTSMSFPDIGRAFGGRDHSTAIHAFQKIDFELKADQQLEAAVQAIETALGK